MPRYYKETCSTDKAAPVEYEVKTKDADASLLYLILQSLQVMKKQSWETSRNNAEVYGVIFGYGDEDADDGAERISDGLGERHHRGVERLA